MFEEPREGRLDQRLNPNRPSRGSVIHSIRSGSFAASYFQVAPYQGLRTFNFSSHRYEAFATCQEFLS
ncbi:MAG: hypothetical protein QM703_07690 [Gemmatales bacterium]